MGTDSGHGGRRQFLIGGAAAVAGAAAGGAGYREYRHSRHEFQSGLEFIKSGAAILRKHEEQTRETVAALKAKYENAIWGKARVWDIVEKLALCIDESDATLYCTSQFIHAQQVLEGMERDGIQDHDLLLAALIHDTGKVLLLAGELPENILGRTGRIGEVPKGAGLDQVVFQFGHGEMVYSRFKDHVPEHLAWLLRYHGTSFRDVEPYMSEKDREYRERYLVPFQKYDVGTKAYNHVPKIKLAKYRDLIEQTFPQPILF